MITFECEKCGHQLKVPAEYAGQEVLCKTCQVMIEVPYVLKTEDVSFDTSFDANALFMARNSDVLEALLRHEQEAPPLETTV